MEYVLPGEVIASEEEFIPAVNTYVDDDGNIRSAKIGKVKINQANKKIGVYGKNKTVMIGDIIEGIAINIRDKMILLSVDKIMDKYGNPKGNYVGAVAIMVSDITNSYIETIKDAAKIGDVIRAEIVSNKAGLFNAQIKGYDYGVVLGFCSKCRHPLQIYKTDSKNRELKEMVCINCRNIEKRKTSKYYTK